MKKLNGVFTSGAIIKLDLDLFPPRHLIVRCFHLTQWQKHEPGDHFFQKNISPGATF